MEYSFTPERAVKMLLMLGVLFAILLMAGGILAIGIVLYGILTMPFIVLVEMAVRFFLISLVLYIAYRGVSQLMRSFRREEI